MLESCNNRLLDTLQGHSSKTNTALAQKQTWRPMKQNYICKHLYKQLQLINIWQRWQKHKLAKRNGALGKLNAHTHKIKLACIYHFVHTQKNQMHQKSEDATWNSEIFPQLLPPSQIAPRQKVLYTLLLCLHGPGIRYFPFLDWLNSFNIFIHIIAHVRMCFIIMMLSDNLLNVCSLCVSIQSSIHVGYLRFIVCHVTK